MSIKRTRTTKDELDKMGLKSGRRVLVNVSGMRIEYIYESHDASSIKLSYVVPRPTYSWELNTVDVMGREPEIPCGRKFVTYKLSDVSVNMYGAENDLPKAANRSSLNQFDPDDVLRVTEVRTGRQYVANHIRGDCETITVNPDQYNERSEKTYKREDVIISLIGPIADVDKVVF